MKTFLVKLDLIAGIQDKPTVHLIRADNKLDAMKFALEHEQNKDCSDIDECFLESIEAFIHIVNEVTEVAAHELSVLKKVLYSCRANLNLQLNIAA